MKSLATTFRVAQVSSSAGVVALAAEFEIPRPVSLRKLMSEVYLYIEHSLRSTCRIVRFPPGQGVRALARQYGIADGVSLRSLIRTVWDHSSLGQIQHWFVLMMENRSFDHMLGFSGIDGVDSRTGQTRDIDGLTWHESDKDFQGVIHGHESNKDSHGTVHHVSNDGWLRFPLDPNHQFPQVMRQICGSPRPCGEPTNSGFVLDFEVLVDDGDRTPNSAPGAIMKCMRPDLVPILSTLAREFALCDSWFSSMPGPTWPNRFFVHAATAGGYDHDPSGWDKSGFIEFSNGTIFDRLTGKHIPWRVYRDTVTSQTVSMLHVGDVIASDHVEGYGSSFSSDMADADFPFQYVFIEPDNDIDLADIVFGGGGSEADSQHPPAHLWLGEQFIKGLYEALRASPHWEKSALIITYDEHGGFFDHVPPPKAVAPGDKFIEPLEFGFDFTRLGVRVPAIVISPWIPRNTIFGGHRPQDIYDHTSILATLEKRFDLAPLTRRDAVAQDVSHVFRLSSPRQDTPVHLPAIPDFDEDLSKPPPLPRPISVYRKYPMSEFHRLPNRLRTQLIAGITNQLQRVPLPDQEKLRGRLKSLATVGDLIDALRELQTRPAT